MSEQIFIPATSLVYFRNLFISGNEIGFAGLDALASPLQHLTQLTILKLGSESKPRIALVFAFAGDQLFGWESNVIMFPCERRGNLAFIVH